jgi:hypothetical protein
MEFVVGALAIGTGAFITVLVHTISNNRVCVNKVNAIQKGCGCLREEKGGGIQLLFDRKFSHLFIGFFKSAFLCCSLTNRVLSHIANYTSDDAAGAFLQGPCRLHGMGLGEWPA